MPVTSTHQNMRRCLLSDAGVRNAYLDDENSLLLAGTSWKDQQGAGAGTTGLTVTGTFTNPQPGQYVFNVTKDFEAQILSIDGSELTLLYPLQTAGTNWGDADGTAASKLINSAADFSGITAGMIVAKRDLSDHALITAVDSATQLSLSKDLFASGDKYTIMEGFEVGDTIKLGTAILDGSEGQVMVEIPKFYYRYEATNPGHRWAISPVEAPGFSVHKAFIPGGVEKDYIYVSAFEGVIDSRGQGTNSLTSHNLGTAKLGSYAGFHPLMNGQRSEFRQVAANRGAGWHQQDWHTLWALQLLFLTEYESLNSQQALGPGMTDWSGNDISVDYNPAGGYYPAMLTGFSLKHGNGSFNTSGTRNVGSFNSYRGVENFWGNIWKFTDGVNYNDGRVYLANAPENYADDTAAAPYVDTGFTQPDSGGYQSEIHNSPDGFIVKANAGGSTTYLSDYYWYNPGWRVVRSGGDVTNGARAGFASLSALSSASLRYSHVGGRVCFR